MRRVGSRSGIRSTPAKDTGDLGQGAVGVSGGFEVSFGAVGDDAGGDA